MVFILPANVPLYLCTSAFYLSLSEDSEEIEIPDDCYRENDHVGNVQELAELLNVLRFWGVETIPTSVIHFCFNNAVSLWDCVVEEFQQELQYVVVLKQICGASEKDQLQLAVQSGIIELVKHTFEMFPLPFSMNSQQRRVNIYEEAAARGHLHVLQYFYESSVPVSTATEGTSEPRTCKISRTQCAVMWNRDTIEACDHAASNGHLNCLQYLVEHGCDCGMNVALAAARNGHLDCLQYVAEFGASYKNTGVAYFAAMNGHLSCLQFAVENGFPVHSGVIDMCAEKGHTEFIKHFYNTSYRQHIVTSKQLLFSVVKGDHIELLQFLLECGVPLHVELPRIAATNGSVNCLRYVIEHGCIVPTNIVSVAAT